MLKQFARAMIKRFRNPRRTPPPPTYTPLEKLVIRSGLACWAFQALQYFGRRPITVEEIEAKVHEDLLPNDTLPSAI